jgi:hypothetical protein
LLLPFITGQPFRADHRILRTKIEGPDGFKYINPDPINDPGKAGVGTELSGNLPQLVDSAR